LINKHAGDSAAQKNLSPRRGGADESNGEVSESGVSEGVEVKNLDSKSFGAQASKFKTQPNRRNKVIIVDEEEEKEFGVCTSINNHISIGSIEDQEHRLLLLA
jgi:hypothetical protein